MRWLISISTVASFLLLADAVSAAPPPPPNFDVEQAIAAKSCGISHEIAKGEPVAINSEKVSIDMLGGSSGRVGQLSFLWGLRLSSNDPRFGGITGLAIDNNLGLIAITDRDDWITFDLEHGSLDGVKSVGIAPMLDVGGHPSAIIWSGSYLVSVPDRRTINRFELGICGLNAKSVTIAQANLPVRAMAPVASSFTLFAGAKMASDQTVDTIQNFNFLNPPGKLTLDRNDIDNVSGFEMVSAVGPDLIVPYDLLSLWRPVNGTAETIIRTISFPHWSDVEPVPNVSPSTLANIPLALSAITGVYHSGEDFIVVATHAKSGEQTYLFAFKWKPSHS